MLQAYINDTWIPIINKSKYYIEYQYGGQHLLSFSLPSNDEINQGLLEEISIKEESENAFLIKKINRVGSYIDYQCELDLDDFKKNVYKATKDLEKFQTKTLEEVIKVILPVGWKVVNANIRDIKRTIELEGGTDYDVLFKCEEIFDVVFEIDVLNKQVQVIDPEQFEYTGTYIHKDLNLKSYSMKGDSSTLLTRLYCEGKEGLTFATINNGMEYVENHDYKNKILSAYWKDERYTVAESLLIDAKKKLKELAIPKRSYVFNVIDLATLDKNYNFLAIHLYHVVKVIIDTNLSIMNKVVKYRKYFDEPEKSQNVVTLSNEVQTINKTINNALGRNINDPVQGSFLEQAKKESTQLINEFATKGHRYETDSETYFLDKMPKEAAKCVMRMNLGGIAFSQNGWAGPYTTAWTIDGKFNADFIAVGVLKAIRIEAAKIFGGSININNRFMVDENGNLSAESGHFKGNISGSDITGSSFTGGVITSQSGKTMVRITEGKVLFFYNGELWSELYSGVSITTGDDIAGRGTLHSTSSIYSQAQLGCAGNLRISKSAYATKFVTASDKRLKNNIADIDISKLLDVTKIKQFKYNNEKIRSVGVIANDYIDTDFEEYMIRENKDGYYSVDYNVFLMACIQKIQKQQEQIDELFKILKDREVV